MILNDNWNYEHEAVFHCPDCHWHKHFDMFFYVNKKRYFKAMKTCFTLFSFSESAQNYRI